MGMRLRSHCCLLACWATVLFAGAGPARPQALPPPAGEETRVWLRDLESLGLGRVQWEAATRVGLLSTAAATLEFRPGRPEVAVWTIGPAGAPVVTRHRAPCPPALVGGRLMVPLRLTCRLLGVSPPDAEQGPGPLATEDHPDPQASGAITGLVTYNGRPLPDVVLRLVRDEDSAFVRDRRAVSDAQGYYRFPGVRAGRYRVYAYVADNPDHFNRETAPVTVARSAVTAPSLAMGRAVRPVAPLPGARLPRRPRLRFAWTPCPGAAHYELSITDPETNEEVAFVRPSAPEAEMAAERFASGRWYQWRVVALGEDGTFLGSTPGAGGEPWRFLMGGAAPEGQA